MGGRAAEWFALRRECPPKLTPTSKLAGTPISDDETVAKMGHSNFCCGLDLGHPPKCDQLIETVDE
jgi:hypothetical protein